MQGKNPLSSIPVSALLCNGTGLNFGLVIQVMMVSTRHRAVAWLGDHSTAVLNSSPTTSRPQGYQPLPIMARRTSSDSGDHLHYRKNQETYLSALTVTDL